MKIIFMGTPDFSANVLRKLNVVYPVSAVVTGTDKPVGRGHRTAAPPLKLAAQELGIPVLQYDKVSREGIEQIRALAPDVIVTAAFGQILTESFLAVPKFGVLNVHASLLPKYRGAAPIQWAILNGDSETGVTIMRTVKAVDAGDILLKKRVEIGANETAGELFDRLSDLGGDAIVEAIGLLESGNAVFTPQNESEATHCSMISKADGHISFDCSAKQLDSFVRGMTPWPSAYAYLGGKLLKIFQTEDVSDEYRTCDAEAGSVIAADCKRGLVVVVRGGAVRLRQLQLEGSKRMSDNDFLRGNAVEIGTRL